ncbi:MAG: MATE family efflux transporter [Spirochaetaceae bacterium]|nr:MATE family efflux transporter [Spirochaetaceae bacterium]
MKSRHLFNDRQFYRSLFTMAIPIMLQNLVNAFVNMVDTVMIGRLGTVEIAAVGLGNQFFFLYNMILFGISSGGAIFTAQFWGRQDIPGIRKNMGLCLILTLGTGVFFTLASLLFSREIMGIYSKDPAVISAGTVYLRTLSPSYIPYALSFVFILTLRSTEKVRLAMEASVIALSINMILNYVFIFGLGSVPAMGVQGAAAATVIARLAEMIILISVSYGRSYVLAGSIRDFLGFNRPFARQFFRITTPVVCNELLWSLGVTVQNIIMARTHTDAIAAFNITNTVSQLTFVVFIGLGNGAAVLVGNRIGAGAEDTARIYASRLTRFSVLVAVAVGLIFLSLSPLIPLLFNVNPNVIAITSAMFIILSCSYPFKAFNMSMIVGVCRAGGDTVFCIFYDLFFMWCFSLPLAAAATFFFRVPVWLIFLFIIAEEPLKTILGFRRLRTGKWLHNVVSAERERPAPS